MQPPPLWKPVSMYAWPPADQGTRVEILANVTASLRSMYTNFPILRFRVYICYLEKQVPKYEVPKPEISSGIIVERLSFGLFLPPPPPPPATLATS